MQSQRYELYRTDLQLHCAKELQSENVVTNLGQVVTEPSESVPSAKEVQTLAAQVCS